MRPSLPLLVVAILTIGLSSTARSTADGRGPQLVSPGDARHEGRVATGCPTFSWAPDASLASRVLRYELTVYDGFSPEASRAVLRRGLPAGTSAWTPDLGDCLPPGRYGWAVAALVTAGDTAEAWWSQPATFRVEPRQSAAPSPRFDSEAAGKAAAEPPRFIASAAAVPAEAPVSVPIPRSRTGAAYAPPGCTDVFPDVTDGTLCPWIEKLYADGITQGCGGGNYCPDQPVTRGQIALLLERAMRGTDTWRPELGDGNTANQVPSAPTLTPFDTTDVVGQYVSITVGADGLGLISFYDVSNGDLAVAHCSDVACAAATATGIDSDGNVGLDTSIAVGADGLGLISYRDETNHRLKVAHCSDVACTSAAVTAVDEDSLGHLVGGNTAITIGSDGLGLITYWDQTDNALKIAHCLDQACSAIDNFEIVQSPFDDVFPSITLGADGSALIAYAGTITGTGVVIVAHCSNVLCSSSTKNTITSGMLTFGHPSITIGSDGFGVISYTESDNLRIAHCLNAVCDSFNNSSPIRPAMATSTTIGGDGLPLISTYGVPADLVVTHCANLDCTSHTSTTVDSAGDVGQYNSITLAAEGLGLIAYYDATNHHLKTARCSNVFCSPHFRRR